MKREIKFRAWNPHGIMVYHGWRDPDSVVHDLWQFVVALPDDAILMQFTGLRDKNGREIYEGDILKIYGSIATDDPAYGFYEPFSVITYYDGAFGFWAKENSIPEFFMLYRYLGNKEVIGNIYENPELL